MRESEPIAVSVESTDKKAEEEDFMRAVNLVSEGRITKMDVDYTSAVDEALPRADALFKKGQVSSSIDSLSPLEKQSRLGGDMRSNARLVRHMVKLAFDGHEYPLLGETIRALCKKRSLIKYAIKFMVKDACEMLDKMDNEAARDQLIETLRTVTAGKIYVEVERARLTKRVVDKLEAEDKLEEARTMIMELQIETQTGSMEVKEKVQFLLHQMRLSIALKDFFRAGIISRKISVKFFDKDDDEIRSMKLEYYNYVIGIGLSERQYLDVCKHYLVLFRDEKLFTIEDDAESSRKMEILKRVVLYVLLSHYDNEQSDLLHRIRATAELERLPDHRKLIELFATQELIPWSKVVMRDYGPLLRCTTKHSAAVETSKQQWSFMFSEVFPEEMDGNDRFELLHKCVGEHNVRMVAKYYTRISFDRMATLLEYSVEEMETYVCNLIADATVAGVKIHRPSRVINMRAKRPALDVLDKWEFGVRRLTDTLDNLSHLILKEEMVHGVRAQT